MRGRYTADHPTERNVREMRIASEGGWGAYLPEAMGQLLKSWKAPRFPSRARSHATWELTTEMKADAISERGWPAQPD